MKTQDAEETIGEERRVDMLRSEVGLFVLYLQNSQCEQRFFLKNALSSFCPAQRPTMVRHTVGGNGILTG